MQSLGESALSRRHDDLDTAGELAIAGTYLSSLLDSHQIGLISSHSSSRVPRSDCADGLGGADCNASRSPRVRVGRWVWHRLRQRVGRSSEPTPTSSGLEWRMCESLRCGFGVDGRAPRRSSTELSVPVSQSVA